MDFNDIYKEIKGDFNYEVLEVHPVKSGNITTRSRVDSKCPRGHFISQELYKYRKGVKCKKCRVIDDRLRNKEEFIRKSNEIHNGIYDYSKVEYINTNTNVTIICPKHGEFNQLPRNHKSGMGCLDCANEPKVHPSHHKVNRIIKRNAFNYRDIHLEELDEYYIITFDSLYCTKVYKDSDITTKEVYGYNSALYLTLYRYYDKYKISHILTYMNDEEFLFIVNYFGKDIHNSKYTYRLIEGSREYIEVKCPKHGWFSQKYDSHINLKMECFKCKSVTSNIELDIKNILDSYGVEYIHNDREVLKGLGKNGSSLELDFYVPGKNFAIEVNGNRWHSEAVRPSPDSKNHMYNKYKLCKDRDIFLLSLYEDEIINNLDLIKSMIGYKLGFSQARIYARNTEFRKIEDKSVVDNFLDTNHIQGKLPYFKEAYGLYYEDILVSVMTFNSINSIRGKKSNKTDIELTRFCNVKYLSVVGGANKLLTNYLRINSSIKNILSYSDNRISDGNLYKALGFTIDNIVEPNYMYIKDSENFLIRYHKSNFRKSRLKVRFPDNYDDSLTEVEIARSLGYYRIYDVGKIKWIKKL